MGNFENNIPTSITQLEAQIKILWTERNSLNWGHDCDCEYCSEQEVVPSETEEKSQEIDQKIADIKTMIKRLKRHAVVNGVDTV